MDMGLSHADFFRTLPAAMSGQSSYRVTGEQVICPAEADPAASGRSVLIELQPERERRIALLSLPTTEVQFQFNGYRQPEVDAFMAFFMSRYQRGGG